MNSQSYPRFSLLLSRGRALGNNWGRRGVSALAAITRTQFMTDELVLHAEVRMRNIVNEQVRLRAWNTCIPML